MLVEQHADWLDRQLSRHRAREAALAIRPALGEGRTLRVAGELIRVSTVDDGSRRPARGRVEPHPGGVVVRLGRDGRGTPTLLEAWLRHRAREVLATCVRQRATGMGVTPARISVRDQATRWGSASPRGALSFSWRLVLAPPEVLDSVVVHELAHLRVRGHGPAFWALVEHHAPATRASRRWLREHAWELRAALC
jgi:hypothetical protein